MECDVSAELHCLDIPQDCFGNNDTNKFETPLESFKEMCDGALILSGTELQLSSGFNPPKKDNYFVAVGITTHNMESKEKDVIIMGVRRPKGGNSNDEDEVFYGYIEQLGKKVNTYHDIEWMYNYFGKKLLEVFPSAIYPGAPLGHVFKFWRHDFFLQWFSPKMGKSSFAMTKNQTEEVISKMDKRYQDEFKDIAMASLDVKKKYHWLFMDGYAEDDFRKTGKLSLRLTNHNKSKIAIAHDTLPMVLTPGSSPTDLQPLFFMPNGTRVNLAPNATSATSSMEN